MTRYVERAIPPSTIHFSHSTITHLRCAPTNIRPMHDTTEPSYTVARPGAGQANLNAVEDPDLALFRRQQASIDFSDCWHFASHWSSLMELTSLLTSLFVASVVSAIGPVDFSPANCGDNRTVGYSTPLPRKQGGGRLLHPWFIPPST